jgi:DNA polymerase-4
MELMHQVLGENGLMIWRKANGIDVSPVEPYDERKSISTESTFDKDTIDVTFLKQMMISMTEKLTYQLRSENKLTSCVTVKIRYSDFNTYTMQSRIAYTALDHTLIEKTKELFDKLFQKRLLVRLIGIRFSHLVQGNYQFNLFDDMREKIMLYDAMDKLRNRYGIDAVQRASAMQIRKHSFVNPFNGIKTIGDLVKKTRK